MVNPTEQSQELPESEGSANASEEVDQHSQQDSELDSYEPPEGDLHLRIALPSKRELALPATGIREVISQSPNLITPMPNASVLLLGTMNLRGEVIWVADLPKFLGDTETLTTERSEIPVVAIEDQEMVVGLAVEQIADMEWLDQQELEIPIDLADEIAPFVQGEWHFEDSDKPSSLPLLDPAAIMRSARWAA